MYLMIYGIYLMYLICLIYVIYLIYVIDVCNAYCQKNTLRLTGFFCYQVVTASPKPAAACTGAPENIKRGGSWLTPSPAGVVEPGGVTPSPLASVSCEFFYFVTVL